MTTASVLIPAYNARETIGDSIASVQSQLGKYDIEIIVCDDASRDNTSAVVKELSRSDPRIRLTENSSNQGVSKSRNTLLDKATGEWIFFLDADDIFLPGKIDYCIDTCLTQNTDLMFHNLSYLTYHGKLKGCFSGWTFPSATCIKQELIGDTRFPEKLPVGEDTLFFALLRKYTTPLHSENILGGYRIRQGSLTDEYWFAKRVISLWHQRNNCKHIDMSLNDYLLWFSSLPFRERLSYSRKWLGSHYGRISGNLLLSESYFKGGYYASLSIFLNPEYLVKRLSRLKPEADPKKLSL